MIINKVYIEKLPIFTAFLIIICLIALPVYAFKDFYFYDVVDEPNITQNDIDNYIAALPLSYKYKNDDDAMEVYLKNYGLSYKRFMFIIGKIPYIHAVSEGRELINMDSLVQSMVPTPSEIELFNLNREKILFMLNEYGYPPFSKRPF